VSQTMEKWNSIVRVFKNLSRVSIQEEQYSCITSTSIPCNPPHLQLFSTFPNCFPNLSALKYFFHQKSQTNSSPHKLLHPQKFRSRFNNSPQKLSLPKFTPLISRMQPLASPENHSTRIHRRSLFSSPTVQTYSK
jgi:hypothetical protein